MGAAHRLVRGAGLVRAAGLRTLSLIPAPDAVDLTAVPAGDLRRAALTDRWLTAADVRVRIPIASSVDSLNVAAVACYATSTRGDG